MKNSSKILLHIFFCCFFLFQNKIFASEITFDTVKINITNDGKIIKAGSGTVFSKDDNLTINAESFEYNKVFEKLNANNGLAILSEKKIEIKANKFIYDKKNSTIKAVEKVKIKDLTNNITIKTENIFYKNDIIESTVKSTFIDKLGNIFITDNFIYTLDDDLIKISNAKITDVENNVYHVEKAFVNLSTNRLIGKDISINFNNINFNQKNDTRMKGKTINANNEKTVIEKGIFTTCKKTDKCPPWQFEAKKITHDKNKKTIFYKDALLKIYDVPVLYFPKFFHPDPTVKRQSGFLPPTFISSNSTGGAFILPYFKAISNSKDLTLSPRLYSKNQILLQTEYRSVDAKSTQLIDFSFLNQKKLSSKTHFFSNTITNLDLNNFDQSIITLQLQHSSNDTYLKKYKLKSPLINNPDTLTSSLGFTAMRDDLIMETEFLMYETLNKKKSSDKYEYIYPSYKISKDLDTNLLTSGNINLSSNGYIKNHNTNVFEKVMVNDFIYSSYPKFTNNGLKHNFNFLVKNVNTDSKNSKQYKGQLDNKIATLLEYKGSFPLQKKTDKYTNMLKPTFSARYSPNKSSNMREEDVKMDVNNVFSLNRIGSNESVEGGASLSFGSEFYKTDFQENEIFNAKIANVLRIEEDRNLPINSSLGKKTSDIVGAISYRPNELININYEFSQNENLKDTNYQLFQNELKVNNFITTFEYFNENNTKEKKTYLYNRTIYNFTDTESIAFEGRENKKTKAVEFYNLMYQYRNDCLTAAINYNKDYYSDRDLKPEENIFFELTIIPFGETKSPNLKN